MLFLLVIVAPIAALGILGPSLLQTPPVSAQPPQETPNAEIVAPEVDTPVVPDTGVDNIGVVDPVVTDPAVINAARNSDKVIFETKQIMLPASNKPGQISTQAHYCNITVWQNFSVAPIVIYGAYTNCSPGIPLNIQLVLERSNVNTPYNYLQSSKAPTFNCPIPQNVCLSPTYKHTVSGTKHLHAVAIATWFGTQGEVVGSPKVRATWQYNDKGAAYPQVKPSAKFDMVPFPSPRWDVCDDDPTKKPTCKKSSDYRAKLIEEYNDKNNNWTYPSQPYQAHHIKPSQFGGGNSLSNLVFLNQPQEHIKFSRWWRSFNPAYWPTPTTP